MIQLTDGEKRVLQATDGRSIKEIADDLGMTERNVKYYSDILRFKFGCTARRQLIPVAQQYFGTKEMI